MQFLVKLMPTAIGLPFVYGATAPLGAAVSIGIVDAGGLRDAAFDFGVWRVGCTVKCWPLAVENVAGCLAY